MKTIWEQLLEKYGNVPKIYFAMILAFDVAKIGSAATLVLLFSFSTYIYMDWIHE